MQSGKSNKGTNYETKDQIPAEMELKELIKAMSQGTYIGSKRNTSSDLVIAIANNTTY